jgi:hypothetical protein
MNYRIIIEEGLAIIKYGGSLDLNTIRKFIKIQKRDEQLLSCKKHLIDIRNASFNFTVKDLDTIKSDLLNSTNKKYREAFLVSSPKETALLILFQRKTISTKLRIMYFSQPISALKYLKLDLSPKELNIL